MCLVLSFPLAPCRVWPHMRSHGTTILLSVKAITVFEISGRKTEIQQSTDLVQGKLGTLDFGYFLTISTASDVAVQVKRSDVIQYKGYPGESFKHSTLLVKFWSSLCDAIHF